MGILGKTKNVILHPLDTANKAIGKVKEAGKNAIESYSKFSKTDKAVEIGMLIGICTFGFMGLFTLLAGSLLMAATFGGAFILALAVGAYVKHKMNQKKKNREAYQNTLTQNKQRTQQARNQQVQGGNKTNFLKKYQNQQGQNQQGQGQNSSFVQQQVQHQQGQNQQGQGQGG